MGAVELTAVTQAGVMHSRSSEMDRSFYSYVGPLLYCATGHGHLLLEQGVVDERPSNMALPFLRLTRLFFCNGLCYDLAIHLLLLLSSAAFFCVHDTLRICTFQRLLQYSLLDRLLCPRSLYEFSSVEYLILLC